TATSASQRPLTSAGSCASTLQTKTQAFDACTARARAGKDSLQEQRRRKKRALDSSCPMALFAVLRASPVAAAAAAVPSFGRGASELRVTSSKRHVSSTATRSLSIRCEQSVKQGGGGGADVWLGRAAMLGFASAVAVEVSTGKGFLQNLGVATPAPTLALVVSGLVVGLAVFFLLQSGGSRD
ncbi:unnamed protein product, partial [Urochloa humidicola]